jgi:hypothetical protein
MEVTKAEGGAGVVPEERRENGGGGFDWSRFLTVSASSVLVQPRCLMPFLFICKIRI